MKDAYAEIIIRDDDAYQVDGEASARIAILDKADQDEDQDGLPDLWEIEHELQVGRADGNKDPDKDGVSNKQEYQTGTAPQDNDTDGDGLDDRQDNAPLDSKAGLVAVSIETRVAATKEGEKKSGQVEVRRSGDVKQPLTVHLALQGTAKNGEDYIALAEELVLPKGKNSAQLIISPYADGKNEGIEQVKVVLLADASYQITGTNYAKVAIRDENEDDEPTSTLPNVSMEVTTTATIEGQDQPGRLVVRRQGDNAQPLTVQLVFRGTANNGEDYPLLTNKLVFPKEVNKQEVLIAPYADDIQEEIEYVEIKIAEHDSYQIAGANRVRIALLENKKQDQDGDGLPDAWEKMNGLQIGTRDENLDLDSDGLLNRQEFVLNTAAQQADTDDDGIADLLDPAPNDAAEGVTHLVMETVVAATVEGQEPAGQGVVRRLGDIKRPLTVHLACQGSAHNGDDYVFIPEKLVFPKGVREQQLLVSSYADEKVEEMEYAKIAITADPAYQVDGDNFIRVKITDRKEETEPVPETVNISLETLVDATVEGQSKEGKLVIHRSGSLKKPLTVRLAYRGTAQNGEDYDLLPTELVFAKGVRKQELRISATPDEIAEEVEDVKVVIVDDPAYQITGEKSSRITIFDKD